VLTPLYKGFELIRSEGHRLGDIFKYKFKSSKEVVDIKSLVIPQDKKNDGVPFNHVSIPLVMKLSDFGVFQFSMGFPCYKAPELLWGSTNYSTATKI
jgi:hypothetical protein